MLGAQKLDRGKISSFQIMFLLFLTRMGAITISFPFIMGHESPTDAWIGAVIGVAVSLLLVELIVRLGMRFPDMTPIQYSQVVLGRIPGSLVGLVLIWFWISDAALSTRALGAVFSSSFMSETPVMAFVAPTVLLAANAGRNGLEVVGRWGEFAAIWLLASSVILVLPYSFMQSGNLLPILPYGLRPHLKAALTIVAFYMRLNVVAMVIPLAHDRKEVLRYVRYAVLLSGLMAIALTVVLVAVFGSQATKLTVPSLALAKQIYIGQFLERIEIIPVITWVSSTGAKTALNIWAAAVGLAQLWGLKRFRPITYPVGALVVALSYLLFRSPVDEIAFVKRVWPLYAPLLVLGTTLIMYVGSLVRSRRERALQLRKDSPGG